MFVGVIRKELCSYLTQADKMGSLLPLGAEGMGYPSPTPSPKRKKPAGGYRTCLYFGDLCSTSASCTDPELPMYTSRNVPLASQMSCSTIEGTSFLLMPHCQWACKACPNLLHLFCRREMNPSVQNGHYFLNDTVDDAAHCCHRHGKDVSRCSI